jgi:hypothetical protein
MNKNNVENRIKEVTYSKAEAYSKWFDIVLCEYNSLRTEAIESLKSQQSIINYGLTVIGVLIGFTGSIWMQKTIVEIIYIVFIPFLCNFITLTWNGEVNRMSRAGRYIKQIEDKINRMVKTQLQIDEPALYWESYLRELKKEGRVTTNNKRKRNYFAILGMFGLLSYLSVLIGIFHNYIVYNNSESLWIHSLNKPFILITLIVLILNTCGFIHHVKYFIRVKK